MTLTIFLKFRNLGFWVENAAGKRVLQISYDNQIGRTQFSSHSVSVLRVKTSKPPLIRHKVNERILINKNIKAENFKYSESIHKYAGPIFVNRTDGYKYNNIINCIITINYNLELDFKHCNNFLKIFLKY